MWGGDGGTGKKTGGGAGGGRDEDVKILSGSNEDGQDKTLEGQLMLGSLGTK